MENEEFKIESLNKYFILAVALNIAFVVVEAVAGYMHNSMSLISDAGHNLSDSLGLVLVLASFFLANLNATPRFTYGFKKTTILISLFNALLLIFAVCMIIYESIVRMGREETVDGETMTAIGAVALAINCLTVYLLSKGQKRDIAIRSLFIHKLADIMVSVGVIISGFIISLTGWTMLDRIVSLVIAVIVLVPSIKLLVCSVRLSLDGVPEGIEVTSIQKVIEGVEGVSEVHHLHVWALSTQENALTAHVFVNCPTDATGKVISCIRARLLEAGIHHVTIEVEREQEGCEEHECNFCNSSH